MLKNEDGLDDPNEVNKFKFTRNGDHLFAPFQCDLYQFRNIKLRDPRVNVIPDKKLLVAIRRANLDAFWGRSSNIVASNRGDVKKILRILEGEFGISNIFPPMGPHPLEDRWGVAIICCIFTKDTG